MGATLRKRRRLAAALLATPAMALVPSPAIAQQADHAQDRPIVAMGGVLDPLGGGVQGHSGQFDPLVGRIRTFSGDLDPFVGRIRTFQGDVDPYVGRIRTFAGDIDPYKGLIRTFWGNLTPVQGELDPSVGRIRTFSDSFLPQSRDLLALWERSEASGDYGELVGELVGELRALEQQAAAQWGDAVMQRTGQSFADGFSSDFFAKWNVDLADTRTLADFDAFDRQRMLLDWYDNVLSFSSLDRVDHWMNAVGWTPALTQTQGSGSRAVIGLVDFFAANDADVRSKVVYSGGYQNVNNAHGAAVGSLIVASHDGRGVMGIAPRAKVAAYNPFDATLTASWSDVTRGIIEVGRRDASVINLSLGVPGYTLPAEWKNVFRNSDVQSRKDQTLFVIAAGNDGVSQTRNVDMNGAFDSTFILVGSVDPNGQISSFSNTPGTACLTDGSECKNTRVWNETYDKFQKSDYLKESGLLMNRFLVAPGEMILVSDGEGGVTRMSGTSFAAPLVSGAIALIQDRWPWLKNYPRDVAKIILESAQDLGAPGVDPIYGHGLLDIEAAQAALDFNRLTYYLNGQTEVKVSTLQSRGFQPTWATKDMYFAAFEKVDSAERDFLIPLSSRLFNANVSGRAYQEFMYHLFVAWLNGSSFTAGPAGFTDSAPRSLLTTSEGWSISMRARRETVHAGDGAQRPQLRSTVEVTSAARNLSLSFGHGDGAVVLGGNRALQMSSDFDPSLGGANPLLGYASGGTHVAARVGLAAGLDVSFGVTRQDRPIDQDLASAAVDMRDHALLRQVGNYQAQAATVRLDYRPVDATTLAVSYSRLAEEGAFFGVRSLERDDLGKSTVSHGLTLAADTQLGHGTSVFGSGTVSQSGSAGEAALRLERAVGTAFQLGIAKDGVFGRADRLRLTLAQPLTVERGTMTMQMIGVIDRETGEKGIVTQQFEIGAPEQRRLRMEALYGARLFEGSGELSLFGSAELRRARVDIPAFAAGANLRLPF